MSGHAIPVLFALLAASAPVQVSAASAQGGTVDVGLSWLGDDAWRFGRYSGVDREGVYAVLDLDWRWRDPLHSTESRFCRIEAVDLGLDSRQIHAGFGRQGVWRANVEFAQQPARRDGISTTVMRGAGGADLSLPAGWVPGATTAPMSALLPSLVPVELRSERRRLAFGLEGILSERWEFAARAARERKDGLRPYAGVIGATGGNSRAVFLPEPIDYETREIELLARYSAPRQQYQARYFVSRFENANPALTWQNPFAGVGGLNPAASFPGSFGRVALPPDNRFHQVSLTGGWALSEQTRLTADVAFGQMRQNADLLAYTVNPVLADTITEPLPRASLDGRIDTTAVVLRATSRRGQRFSWTASYRYDDRDNATARDAWVYIPGDSLPQDASESSSRRRFNLPVSYRDQRARLDLGWRFDSATRLDAHAELREERRTYAERHRAEEGTLGAALQRRFSTRVTAAVRVSRSERDGSTYVGNAPFLSTYAPAYTATVAGEFENVPDLRRFNLADRTRDRAGATLVFAASDRLNISFGSALTRDDYRRSEIGLTDARMRAHTLEASYVWSTALNGYGFYAREALDFAQDGQSIRGGANRLVDLADAGRLWSVQQAERVDTLGGGLVWQDPGRRWRIGLDYALALSATGIDVATGSALTSAPLPPLKTRLHSASLRLQREITPALALRASLRADRYRASDWAMDGVPANQLANVILFGSDDPDYRVTLLTVSMQYRF